MTRSSFFSAKVAVLATLALLVAAAPSEARSRSSVFFFYGGRPNYGGLYGGYYPGYSWWYTSYYYPAPVVYYRQQINIFVMSGTAPAQAANPSDGYQGRLDNVAKIEVKLPATAELWFDGKKKSQTGEVRLFATPPLVPGQVCCYDVRASWTDEAGKTVSRTRTVDVQAGERVVVDMMEEEG